MGGQPDKADLSITPEMIAAAVGVLEDSVWVSASRPLLEGLARDVLLAAIALQKTPEARFNETLGRLVNTPYQPHKPKEAKPDGKKPTA